MRRRLQTTMGVMLLVTLAAACGDEAEPQRGFPQVGEPAPEFTLPSAEGGSVSLSDFRGRQVLLYFSMGPG